METPSTPSPKKGFIYWLAALIRDEHGSPNIKPIIGLVGAFCLYVAFVVAWFTPIRLTENEPLLMAIVTIILFAMGGETAGQIFIKKGNQNQP